MEAVVRAVLDRGDPTDNFALPKRQEERPVGIAIERMLLPIERVVHRAAQGRDPLRMPLAVEQLPGKVHEPAKVAARSGGNDVDWHGQRTGSHLRTARANVILRPNERGLIAAPERADGTALRSRRGS